MFKKNFLVALGFFILSSCTHAGNQFPNLQSAFDAFQNKEEIMSKMTEAEAEVFKHDILEWRDGKLQDPEGKTIKDLNVKLLGGGKGKDDNYTSCTKEVNRQYTVDRTRCDKMPTKDEKTSCMNTASLHRGENRSGCSTNYSTGSSVASGIFQQSFKFWR